MPEWLMGVKICLKEVKYYAFTDVKYQAFTDKIEKIKHRNDKNIVHHKKKKKK